MKITKFKRKALSLLVVILSVFMFFALAALALDVGYVFNCQNELQKALETSSLAGASAIEPSNNNGIVTFPDDSTIKSSVTSALTSICNDNSVLRTEASWIISNVSIDINRSSKAVRIMSSMRVNPFFISILGLNKIEVQAKAAAMAYPVYLSPNFPITPQKGSIVYSDIRDAVGINTNKNNAIDNLYYASDGKGVSLGGGGMLVLRLPVGLINGPGADLYINSLGNAKGYYVFAGVDTDPNSPFVNTGNSGAGIIWQNISCTGAPAMVTDDTSSRVGAYNTVEKVGPYTFNYDAKFYGSGLFDLGVSCIGKGNAGSKAYDGSLTNVQYLMILDDNKEDGFIADDASLPVLLIGDHSSITPGVTIDSVAIFHHSKLINHNDLSIDSDGDGLIDVLENVIATSTTSTDTDGDGISDDKEYLGWFYSGIAKIAIINGSSRHVFFTSPTNYDQDNGIVVPNIKIP